MKKILAIIPARGGSKGVPRKNIKLLNGHPLIEYTIKEANKSSYINKIVVSSDDEEILEVSERIGGCIPLKRRESLAGDKTATVDVILDVLNELKNKDNYVPDYFVLLQPTSPFRNCKHIDDSFKIVLNNDSNSLISVCEVSETPYWMKIIENNKMKNLLEGNDVIRRQDLNKVYIINGAIYIMKTDVFLESKKLILEDTCPYIMDRKFSLDIDTKLDFEMAEVLMSKLSSNIGEE